MDLFGRPFICGDAKFLTGPFAQVEQLAAFTAKRPIWIAGIFGFLLASRTLHRASRNLSLWERVG